MKTALQNEESNAERSAEHAPQEPSVSSGDAIKTMPSTSPLRDVSKALSDPMERWLNKIHCGDCVEIMNEMPAESVGLIVTSPPYNLRNSTGNGMKDGRGGKWEKAKLIEGYETHDDAMPHDEYVQWQRRCLTAMMRVLRDDGVIFYNHKWRVQGGLLQDRHDIIEGFPVRQIIIWKRSGGINFNPGYFLPTYEVIYLICKPNFKLAPKANAQGDIWTIPQESNNPHPAPFPVELAQRCIKSTTAQIVLDPFIGSGSTAIAAEACQRDWIGLDISREYCKMANERIEAARNLLRT
jgi:site-specific DNA-methyltransferase (adenine-specific)